MRIFKNRRTTLLFFVDAVVLTAVYVFIVFLSEMTPGRRLDGSLVFANYIVSLVLCMGLRVVFGLYTNVWRYANTGAYFKIILTDGTSGILTVLVTLPFSKIWYGLWEIVSLFAVTCVVTLATRFLYQLYYRRLELVGDHKSVSDGKIAVAIVGAGQTGTMLAGKAGILGGSILIFIGLWIFIKSWF